MTCHICILIRCIGFFSCAGRRMQMLHLVFNENRRYELIDVLLERRGSEGKYSNGFRSKRFQVDALLYRSLSHVVYFEYDAVCTANQFTFDFLRIQYRLCVTHLARFSIYVLLILIYFCMKRTCIECALNGHLHGCLVTGFSLNTPFKGHSQPNSGPI